jgi:hypothetical protein
MQGQLHVAHSATTTAARMVSLIHSGFKTDMRVELSHRSVLLNTACPTFLSQIF